MDVVPPVSSRPSLMIIPLLIVIFRAVEIFLASIGPKLAAKCLQFLTQEAPYQWVKSICIHICICKYQSKYLSFLSTRIYSYSYLPFLFKPNIFVFVFALFWQANTYYILLLFFFNQTPLPVYNIIYVHWFS